MSEAEDNTQNRRQFSRIMFEADAQILQQGEACPCRVRDLSLQGALLEFADNRRPIGPGKQCTMELALSEDRSAVIRMTGSVIHADGCTVGLHCREMDLESITLLRRLLELNLGDTSLLDREFATLVSG